MSKVLNFNYYEYINNYKDLRFLNCNEAIEHYINYGYSNKYKFNTTNLIDFDPSIYKNLYKDLKFMTNDEAILHYIRYGKFEGRQFNHNLIKLINIKTAKIGIIYVYYERKNEQKNQTNLSFFIKYGLDKNKWANLDITSLFVINGNYSEVIIPNRSDIHILKEDNCSDYEGWYNGIKYFENLYKNKIWNQFDYLCLMNASTCGPFMEENTNKHWLEPFYNKMIKTKSVACSPFINVLDNDHPCPGIHLSCHFTLIKINENIINLLINKKIPSVLNSSHNFELYENTVIGYKKDKLDAILTGEYGLSRILIINNYNICCLYYDEIEKVKPYDYKTNIDREEFYHENNDKLIETIFIKNIWRIENNIYASLPILYDYCNSFIMNKLEMINIFKNCDINYELISKNKIGYNCCFPKYNWNSKEEYYNLYGKTEETIIFNKKKINNNGIAIYYHYDSDNIIKDYVISSIKALIYVGYDIYFCTTSESINNVDISSLPFIINYYKKNEYGNDFIYWYEIIEQNLIEYKSKYEWILLLNDSILLPINGLINFQNTITNMRKNCNFWGHWDSNKIRYHSISSINEYNINLIDDLLNFYRNKLNNNICSKSYFIFELETKQTKYLINKGYIYKCVVPIDTIIIDPINIYSYFYINFNPNVFIQWINREEVFAIKWKYMLNYINNKNINNQILNYLIRYIYFGSYIRQNYQKLI